MVRLTRILANHYAYVQAMDDLSYLNRLADLAVPVPVAVATPSCITGRESYG